MMDDDELIVDDDALELDDEGLEAAPDGTLYEHRRVVADKGQTLLRVDKFLMEHLRDTSRARIQRAAEAGCIHVNDRPVKSNYRVKPFDVVTLMLDHPRFETEVTAEDIPLDIVYEDDDLLVVNKPAGLVVHPGVGNYTGTLVNALAWHLRNDPKYNPNDPNVGLVHRIDKDTRGLLILAKNVPTAVKLTEMFKQRLVHKKYLAVLSGIPLKNSGTIKTHIVLSNKDNMASNAHCMEDRLNGKPAITKYRVLKTNKNNNTALVEFFPLTGRKHQIRLHAQNIKCPIVGDEKYGFGKQKNKKLQLFAVAIDASPVVKVELDEKEINKMIDFE